MQFLQYQPQKRGPRHQNETINNDIDPSRKAFVSHTTSGTIPSTGGLGQPRFPEWNLQRRQTFFTAQTCHTKRKPRKRNTQKEDFDHNMLLNKEKQTEPKEEEKAEFCTEPIGSMCKRPVLVRPGRRAYPNWLREPSKLAQAQRRTTFCKPTSEEYTAYNQLFSNRLTEVHTKNIDTVLTSIRAGTKKLRPTPLGKRQKYLSDKDMAVNSGKTTRAQQR